MWVWGEVELEESVCCTLGGTFGGTAFASGMKDKTTSTPCRGILPYLLNTVKGLLHLTEALETEILASKDTPLITYVSP